MKVKICGITSLSDALFCETAGADALGFIFYKKSKRFIKPSAADKIIRQLSPFTIKVGVFVNEDPGRVNETADKLRLNCIQLHGDEDQEYINKISIPVIKSFRISSGYDFFNMRKFKNITPLLDTYVEGVFGGTGSTFDWCRIPDDLKENVILAGGVSADNIQVIMNEIKPYAVDLSSSVESEPGIKDIAKVKIFFNKLNETRSSKW